MISEQEQQVRDVLAKLGISFERHEHPPVFTVEEADRHWAAIDAAHCKNLFLRNKKGTTHYLAILGHHTEVNLKRLAGQLGDDRLSFASPERLITHLGLSPGSVSPFGLINDRTHRVRVVIDAGLRTAERIAFHPNVNTATVVLAWPDFQRFLAWCGNPVQYVGF